jgi:hypothetical protein
MIYNIARLLTIFFIALLTYSISYFFYRKTSAAFWGYVSAWLFEVPIFLLFVTGAQNIQGFDLFVHTLGIPVMAMLLVIGDILLTEIALIGVLKPLSFILPKNFSSAIRIYDITKALQKYHAIPEPERVKTVFLVSLLGGIISLVILFAAGAFF